VPSDARFCSWCGAPQETGHSPRVETADRIDVFTTPRGEERLVTVAFADLSGSVRQTADLTPEKAMGLVNPLLEAMVELMVRHGGRIDRFLGDGVLAVFGVPEAHEDDPVRAVRAAVELRERAMSLGVSVTVGVNTGRVYFGPVGSKLHEELTVMGPVVNLAARLQSMAEPDQILIGESTFAHVRASFHLGPIRLEIKGIVEPVVAYTAEGLVDHPDRVRGIEGLTTELVGREAELAVLRDSLGAPASLAVVGPAGLGKSRLLSELNREANERGFAWLEGRCFHLTTHAPYAPFLDLLRRLMGTEVTGEAVVESAARLVASGALDAPTRDEIIPFLEDLVGRRVDHQRDQGETSVEHRRNLTIDALVTYLLAAVAKRTAVMVIEDLHWSDDSSVEVIRRLIDSIEDRPVTVVVTSRPDLNPPASQVDSLFGTVLRLAELTSEQTRELVRRLLGSATLPETTEQAIITHAGGNPFYVEEILRDLIQRGLLLFDGGKWQTVASLPEIPVPESLDGLLMSRFDRLPVNIKLTARVASVLDGGFTPPLIAAMAGEERAADLPELIESGLTRLERQGSPVEYGFVHALTRQAIYGSLLPSHRAELHTLAGRALEAVASPDPGRIAYHYERGTDDLKAVEWLFEAARRATEAYANDLALEALDRGMDRLEQLPAELRPDWRGRYLAVRGEVLERAAKYEKARDDLRAALADLDDPIEVARTWTVIGRSHRLQDDFDGAHAALDRAEQAIEEQTRDDRVDAQRCWIDIQRERSFSLYFGGRGAELPRHIERITPVVESHGTPEQRFDHMRSRLLDEFIRTRWVLDDQCVADAERAVSIARSGADPGRTAEGQFVLGFTLLWADRVDEASQALELAVTETRRVGAVVEECRARAYHAVALRRAGRVDEAETAALAALAKATELEHTYYEGHAHAVLCWVEWKRESGRCAEVGEEAYRLWGPHAADGHVGFSCEYTWLAAFPMAADAHRRGESEAAATHLRNLLVPWERPLPADLKDLVARAAAGETEVLGETLELAVLHRLL